MDQLVADLHRKYGADPAQIALLALFDRSTPPRDPVAFCHRVAWRARQRALGKRGEGYYFGQAPLGLEVVQLGARATQLDRVLAREQLDRLRRWGPLELFTGRKEESQ